MDKAKRTFIINNVLRRGTYRWWGRWKAEQRSHIPALKKYFCESCGTIAKRKKDTQMDHIEPVIPVDKTTDTMTLDEIADRMYPNIEGWQRLCKECHGVKTADENRLRPDSAPKPKKIRKKRAKRS